MKAILTAALCACVFTARAGQTVDEQRLVDAIGRAENSKAHPYGIMTRYKVTTPREACLNTVRASLARWRAAGAQGDPIKFVSLTYCPLDDPADVNHVNQNWVKNVTWFYNHQ